MQHLKTSSLALLLLECFNKNNGTKQRGNSRKYTLQIHTGLGDCPYYNIMGKNPKGKLNCATTNMTGISKFCQLSKPRAVSTVP